MKHIIRRLLESRDTSISTDIFDIENQSTEAYDLLETIDTIVSNIIHKYDSSINLDDSGLDGKGNSESAIRTIIYRAEIFRSNKMTGEPVPLKSKEIELIESRIAEKIVLPGEDDEYEYSARADITGTSISIYFRRDRKVEW